MVQAYNFMASWQLFPEKCDFSSGIVPKSGNYRVESIRNGHALSISANWVSQDNEAYYNQYELVPDDSLQDFPETVFADQLRGSIPDSHHFRVVFLKDGHPVLEVQHTILPNGYLEVLQKGTDARGKAFVNKEIYHKQMSVLPYASSVGSVAIRPTEEGVIKHKALSAMEEQTNMQLDQIRQQIELLARQAQEIRKRRELSLMIYEAKLSFKPQIGQVYHLYERNDGSHLLSLVAPSEWGGAGPFRAYVSSVRLLADHTWVDAGA